MKIKVYPNKSKTRIIEKNGRDDIDLHVELKAKAEDNKANIELVKFLSKEYNVPTECITIKSGFKSRIKNIAIKE